MSPAPTRAADVPFDLRIFPFSRFGAFVSFLPRAEPLGEGLYLRVHHGRPGVHREVFRVDTERGAARVPHEAAATPSRLVLTDPEGGAVTVVFDETESLRVRGDGGAGLRLEIPVRPGVVAHGYGEGRLIVNARGQACRFGFERLAGGLELDAPWETDTCRRVVVRLTPGDDGTFETAVDRFTSTWAPPRRRPFGRCQAEAARDFERFLQRTPDVPPPLAAARARAAYLNWSAVAGPGGHLRRPAMLMSKRHMDNVWSWDHCFNAMALAAGGHGALAWDQMMVMADHQDAHGAYPDALNASLMHFNYSKPPVHGWALRYCLKKAPKVFRGRKLRALYEALGRQADWWLTHRRLPGHALPHYLHGNDSGWDNSTMFDAGAPLEAPDLAAVLAVQLEVLADVAKRLRRTRDAERRRGQAAALRKALLDELWREDRFIARRALDGHEVVCDSLVPCMPIVLGTRLPQAVRTALVKRLRGHLTDHGLATERPESPAYEADGYWRGPIWAPSTLLVVDGLRAVGRDRLARTIASRFCRLCDREGFAENFDALTGAGLRDRAYTWTSSVLLVLAHDVLGRPAKARR